MMRSKLLFMSLFLAGTIGNILGEAAGKDEMSPTLDVSQSGGSRRLFQNEGCDVWELELAPGKQGWLPLHEGADHVLLHVGRGILQSVSKGECRVGGDGDKQQTVDLKDNAALWRPFVSFPLHQHTLRLQNVHPHCHSRSILVRLKERAEGGVWRGEEVTPGRRIMVEQWTAEEERDRLMEEVLLTNRSFRTDVGTNVLLEEGDIRVSDFVIQPGEDAPIHQHLHSYFFVNLGVSRSCGLRHDGRVNEGSCSTQADGQVTWIDVSTTPEFKRLRNVHGVRNVGTTWFRQFIVEFLD